VTPFRSTPTIKFKFYISYCNFVYQENCSYDFSISCIFIKGKSHQSRSSHRELRQLNKSLRICYIRLATSDIAYRQFSRATSLRTPTALAVIFAFRRVKDLFNITLTASQNITQGTCISLLATRLKI
jgi:hypothetical protein